MTRIDILYLLDRLEEVLSSGSRLPFSSRTVIDEQECLDILDQIRVALPEEIKQARRVTAERDGIIAEAQARAQQIIREAEERAAEKVEEHALVRQAQARAQQVEADDQDTPGVVGWRGRGRWPGNGRKCPESQPGRQPPQAGLQSGPRPHHLLGCHLLNHNKTARTTPRTGSSGKSRRQRWAGSSSGR